MPLNSSGPISIGGSVAGQSINLEFGRAANATTSMSELYRGGGLVPDVAQNANVPTSGPISLSQFYNATRVVPGSQDFITVGTASFVVPNYNTLIVELWGGGGSGGGGFNNGNGQPGGASSISQLGLTAGGGGAGISRNNGAGGGAGGGASGGNNLNWNGEAGNRAKPNIWTGGRDGRRLNLGLEPNYEGNPFGTVDGGGGRGGYGNGEGGGGGGGGYVRSVYAAGAVAPGASLTIVVGGGGAGLFDGSAGPGGAGARGRIFISWS
jgi:hypothetical protein